MHLALEKNDSTKQHKVLAMRITIMSFKCFLLGKTQNEYFLRKPAVRARGLKKKSKKHTKVNQHICCQCEYKIKKFSEPNFERYLNQILSIN